MRNVKEQDKVSTLIAAAVVAAGLGVGTASAADLYNIATIDLSTTSNVANVEFIGSNPSAIAWTGGRLFVAGFNNSGAAATVGIVEVTDPLGTPGFGTVFGQRASTPSGRGYSGLDANDSDTLIGASYDSGGNIANGVATYTLGGTLQAGVAFRGFAGPSFDPGFNAAGAAQGLGWTRDGSGRRALFDPITGTEIYTTGNGMLHNSLNGITGTLNRDIDFDPDTGDIYVRVANYLVKTPRTADNTTGPSTLLFDPGAQAPFVNGQNLQYISDWGGTGNDFVVYNPRADGASGKVFNATVVGVKPDGTPETLTFLNADGSAAFSAIASTSGGYFDFSYDRATSTLAVLDFSNRQVYIFDDVAETAPFVEGDADSDGDVDFDDLGILLGNYDLGGFEAFTSGDSDGDGDVDFDDLGLLLGNYGFGVPPVPGAVDAVTASGFAVVPEPSSLGLIAAAGLTLARRRR